MATSDLKVTLVSGEELTVHTEAEARWFVQSRDTYLTQTKFTETTDLRDLDRVLFMELMVYRLSQHLAAGVDYEGFEIEDEALLRRNVREYSEQINRTKSSMGLTKSARDDSANGDLSTYISSLQQRAKIFGIHRESQLTKALVLFEELSSIISAYDRADTEERSKLGFENPEEIVSWVRERMIPEYRELDEHFRTHDQRYWIREM